MPLLCIIFIVKVLCQKLLELVDITFPISANFILLFECVKPQCGYKSENEVTQSCSTLSNPMDCSPPGSSVHGIFQARVLEWGAIAFSIMGHEIKLEGQD